MTAEEIVVAELTRVAIDSPQRFTAAFSGHDASGMQHVIACRTGSGDGGKADIEIIHSSPLGWPNMFLIDYFTKSNLVRKAALVTMEMLIDYGIEDSVIQMPISDADFGLLRSRATSNTPRVPFELTQMDIYRQQQMAQAAIMNWLR